MKHIPVHLPTIYLASVCTLHTVTMLEGPNSRLFNKTSPHTPQMAIFDSSILAAREARGRGSSLDQREETKTSQPAACGIAAAMKSQTQTAQTQTAAFYAWKFA